MFSRRSWHYFSVLDLPQPRRGFFCWSWVPLSRLRMFSRVGASPRLSGARVRDPPRWGSGWRKGLSHVHVYPLSRNVCRSSLTHSLYVPSHDVVRGTLLPVASFLKIPVNAASNARVFSKMTHHTAPHAIYFRGVSQRNAKHHTFAHSFRSGLVR
jgi:hypothetical protein